MADVVVGIQWGDEGKGKIVDRIAKDYDFVVRYQGGHNAGHTIVHKGVKHSLHLMPSGVLYPQCKNIISSAVVVSVKDLCEEINTFENLENRLFVSDRAHVILPYHVQKDAFKEKSQNIGTTKKGIGPCYEDKMARSGIRMGDLLDDKILEEKLKVHFKAIEPFKEAYGLNEAYEKDLREYFKQYTPKIRPFIKDTTSMLIKANQKGEKILLEGAQGTLLDIDLGTYPFVTSSNTTSASACVSTGLNPKAISEIIGITKAYCTRVGNGPFPSEDLTPMGDHLRSQGAEFGTTTKRPRRCGWLDLVALKYACALNGCTQLALMKLDVLDGINEIKVCVAYERKGEKLEAFPSDLKDCVPIYQTFKGWEKSVGVRKLEDLEPNAREYIRFIEEEVGVKIRLISTSPEREDTIFL
ncbi:adenylosuccinate synthase [Helicobacter pylori]|uniref:Adenylosuccinate synthetase n=1 Tax=Helicobacter pylori (strain SouthAfrica7) TaxID=907239 RepID=E8QUR4_HELPW|nr:adenylosuccinate synthase [Helicobacter pylori]ADU84282.1 adenylosuccinate synthetase [Helicobacter pylori SouthAfrica7]